MATSEFPNPTPITPDETTAFPGPSAPSADNVTDFPEPENSTIIIPEGQVELLPDSDTLEITVDPYGLGIVVGLVVSGDSIQPGTTVTSVSTTPPYVIGLSQNTTEDGGPCELTFSPPIAETTPFPPEVSPSGTPEATPPATGNLVAWGPNRSLTDGGAPRTYTTAATANTVVLRDANGRTAITAVTAGYDTEGPMVRLGVIGTATTDGYAVLVYDGLDGTVQGGFVTVGTGATQLRTVSGQATHQSVTAWDTSGLSIKDSAGTTRALFGNSGANTITGNTTITGNFTVSGTLTLGSSTLTLAGNLTTSGAFGLTLTTTGTTNVTLPTTGTLATLAGSETFTNKTLTNPTITNFVETVVAVGNTGTSQTIALTNGTVQTATLTGNCTFTMPTATAGKSFTLLLNTGSGGFTATFTGVKWASGSAPTVTTTASRLDLFSFIADGTNWYGSALQNFTP